MELFIFLDWLNIYYQIVLTILLWEGAKWLYDRWSNPHRYQCWDCGFVAKSNSAEIIKTVRESHSHPKELV